MKELPNQDQVVLMVMIAPSLHSIATMLGAGGQSGKDLLLVIKEM